MASRLAAGMALMFMRRPSVYKRVYKHDPKEAQKAYQAAQAQATSFSPANKNLFSDILNYGSKQIKPAKSAVSKKKAVKKHSRVRNLPRSATRPSKGASLLTRQLPDATLT